MTEKEEPGQLVEFEKMVQRFLEMFEIRMKQFILQAVKQSQGTVYNFEGANFQNCSITGNMSKTGPEYHGQENAQTPKSAYTDDVIARAIMAVNGEKKPLCEKQLFLAVIKVLKYKCGWTDKWESACDRINDLPMIKAMGLAVKCDYNNVKAPSALKFAAMDYDEWQTYVPSASEKELFNKNKSVGEAFAEELDKQLKLIQRGVV